MPERQGCPENEELAALIDGKLEGSRRDQLMAHLNDCEDCYSIFSDSVHFLQANESAREPQKIVKFPAESRWRRYLMPAAGLAAAVLILLVGLPLLRDRAVESPWQTEKWWLAQYRLADPQLPEVARARNVFERMLAVYEGPSQVPKLLILDAEEVPFAMALADDAILISRRSLELCFSNAGEAEGNARLAFVLGHELSHLARGELEHAFAAYTIGRPEADELSAHFSGRVQELHERELRADRSGLTYAGMARFDVASIVDEGETFLESWTSQPLHEAAFPSHPTAAERADLLRLQLQEAYERLEYFHFGVRFYQLGEYEKAAEFLERFHEEFPSREVANNLGLIELQRAARVLGACDGNLVVRFKLPLSLDPETIEARSRRRGGLASECLESDAFLEHVEAAEHHLLRASQMDPRYLPARLNLVSLYLLSGRQSEAYEAANEALELEPQATQTRAAHALALYAFGSDRGSAGRALVDRAIETFQDLREIEPASGTIAFNLAAMLGETEREDEARVQWREFLTLEAAGPHADYARDRLGLPAVAAAFGIGSPPPPFPLGPVSAQSQALLDRMEQTVLTTAHPEHTVYQNDDWKLLASDSEVLIVEEKAQTLDSFQSIRERYGAPRRQVEMTVGQAWVYAGFGVEFVEGEGARVFYFDLSSR